MSDHLSVFSVEMMAISVALQQIEELHLRKVVVCSDSSGVLQSLRSWVSPRQDLLLEILESLYRFGLRQNPPEVIFMWVPGHRGVRGNDIVDSLAKRALQQEQNYVIPLSKNEAKAYISSYIRRVWQRMWDRGATGRHLYSVQREVGGLRCNSTENRKEEVMWARGWCPWWTR